MGRKDPRIDAYIAEAAPFAQPILKHLRKIVHAGCPGAVEAIKWKMPHFEYKGMFCGMAAFKQHCAFGFWREAAPAVSTSNANDGEAMGQFGRITSLADLPDEKTLLGYVRKGVELKDAAQKHPKPAKAAMQRAALEVPEDLAAAMKRNSRAQKTWDGFSYSHRKEYIEWLTSARRAETREKRLATALEWIAEGKSQNWRYSVK